MKQSGFCELTAQDTYTAFMMDHAAGNHAEAFALAGDLHMLLSPSGAEHADAWAIIGGVLIEDAPNPSKTPIPEKKWAQTPRRTIDSAEDLVAITDADLNWRRSITGVAYAPTGTPGAKFMKLEAGQAAPMHGHLGLEATVVIQGRFSDGHAEYGRGDLVLGEPGLRHKPQAVGNQPCICFVAQRPRTLWRPFV